jgi:hypothetical protein
MKSVFTRLNMEPRLPINIEPHSFDQTSDASREHKDTPCLQFPNDTNATQNDDSDATQEFNAKAALEEMDVEMEPEDDESEDDESEDDERWKTSSSEDDASEDGVGERERRNRPQAVPSVISEPDVAAGRPTRYAAYVEQVEAPDAEELRNALDMYKQAFIAGAGWMQRRLAHGGPHAPDWCHIEDMARSWVESEILTMHIRAWEAERQNDP